MTADEAVHRLGSCLAQDARGRYVFLCKKAFVMVKVHGKQTRFVFAAKDKLVFRMDTASLTVEKLDSGAIHRTFLWTQIECLAAGEPEKDDGTLFQG